MVKKTVLTAALVLACLLAAPLQVAWALSADLAALKDDYRAFYGDAATYRLLGAAFAAGAVMANTNVDVELQDYYRGHLRSTATDDISGAARIPGELLITVPVVLAVRFVAPPESTAGRWAGYSARALFLGGPLGLALQRATGASRPEERSSGWRPFMDNNGVSGHSFIGSVPFLAASRMTENPYLRGAFLAASALPALSRINDDKHYASQAFLGWFLGYMSVRSVFALPPDPGSTASPRLTMRPMLVGTTPSGVVLERRF